jgi:hypothetical protein
MCCSSNNMLSQRAGAADVRCRRLIVAVRLDVQVWSFGGVSIIMDVSTQLIRAQVSRALWGLDARKLQHNLKPAM